MREQVWAGWLPVVVTMDAPETVEPVTYLLKARRCSYLPLYSAQILEYAKRYLLDPAFAASPSWTFYYEDRPLAWNRPIGLLYDLSVAAELPDSDIDRAALPWRLVLKHGEPSSILKLTASIATVREYWSNQVKEACYIRNGNSNAFMNLSREASVGLWDALVRGNIGEFWSLWRPLVSQKPRHIPLRLYDPRQGKIVQKLVPTLDAAQRATTLGSALNHIAADLFPSTRAPVIARPVLHGAVVPLTAPLNELYEAAYPDGFLHVSTVLISDVVADAAS